MISNAISVYQWCTVEIPVNFIIPQTAGSKYPCIFQFYPHISLWKSTTVGQLLPRSISWLALLSSILKLSTSTRQILKTGNSGATYCHLKYINLHTSYIDVCTTDINRRMTTRSWSRAAPVPGWGMPGRWRAPGGVMLRETVAPWAFGYNDPMIMRYRLYHEVWMWWLTCLDICLNEPQVGMIGSAAWEAAAGWGDLLAQPAKIAAIIGKYWKAIGNPRW